MWLWLWGIWWSQRERRVRKVVDYVVLESKHPENLSDMVRSHLRIGFELYGPLTAAHSGGGSAMAREMVRYEEVPDTEGTEENPFG